MGNNRVVTAVALTAGLLAAACKVDVQSHKSSVDGLRFVSRDSTRHLGPGDIRIASEDSALELAIIGDSVVAGFGQKVRDKIAQKTDTTKVGDGMGASIEKFVKGTVASALNHDMQFPLSEVSDVRYNDGFLELYDRNGNRMHLFDRDKNDRDESHTRFSERDADAFIAAFKVRKTKV